MRSEDLAWVISGPRPESPAVGYHQGVVTEWNPVTGENKVDVNGTTMTNLAIAHAGEARVIQVGSVVGIRTYGASWYIEGVIVRPGTMEARTALSMLRSYSRVAGGIVSVGDTGNSWVAGSPAGPTVPDVTIGPSGLCLVTITANIRVQVNRGSAGIRSAYARAGVEVSGATTRQPTAGDALTASIWYDANATMPASLAMETNASMTTLIGLNPGLHSFAMRLQSWYATAEFSNRTLTIMPL